MTCPTPLISIITVVYNGEKYLQQTIDSVHNQNYKNIEYIIIDGGSTDGTLDIIKENEVKISKWISEPDNGLYDAMNKGANLSSGDLIGTINSDDWYELDAVQNIVNAYLKNPTKKIFHADKNCIEPKGETHIKKAKTSSFLLKYYGMVLNHPTMFIHNDVYKYHQYNINLTSLSDYQYVLSVFLKNKNTFCYIPKVISNFRQGGISGGLSLKQSLKENYFARKNAGMNFPQRIFAILVRLLFEIYKVFK